MSTTSTYPETSGDRSSAEIEAGIRSTRERMDSTLDELGNRLSPRSLVNSLMDWWDKNSSGFSGDGGMKKTYRSLTTHIKSNPVPSLLIGAGVTWLLLKDDDEKDESQREWRNDTQPKGGYTSLALNDTVADYQPDGSDGPGVIDRLKDKAHDAKEAVTGTVEKVKSKVGELTEGAGEAGKMAHNLYDRSQEALAKKGRQLETGYDAAMERMKGAVDEYPLAVGAAFAALGALIGVILPRTSRENALLGEKSDTLVETIKEKGDELLEQGKEMVTELGDKMAAVASEQGFTPEAAGEKLTELASKTGGVLRKAVEEVGGSLESTVKKE